MSIIVNLDVIMAKRKKSQRVYKIGMLVLLALIVLGFTIPGFIDPTGEDQQVNVEPRLCQSDADCYLLCDDVPEQVLCSQNMCVRNSCQEYDLYPAKSKYDAHPEMEKRIAGPVKATRTHAGPAPNHE